MNTAVSVNWIGEVRKTELKIEKISEVSHFCTCAFPYVAPYNRIKNRQVIATINENR
jgi:hypothetical protein